jgi:hypothetical protein
MAKELLTEEICLEEIAKADSKEKVAVWQRCLYHIQQGKMMTIDRADGNRLHLIEGQSSH